MKTKKIIVIVLLSILLTACGESGQSNSNPSSAKAASEVQPESRYEDTKAVEEAETTTQKAGEDSPGTPEGYLTIGGSWKVGGIVYKGSLIDIEDVEALEDLYDNVLITFNEDGSFVYLKTYNDRGSWSEKLQGSDNRFLLQTESVFQYDLQSGALTEKEVEAADLKQYIVIMLDANTFVLYEYDDITGKEKADDNPCIFVKEGEHSDFIAYNKTPVDSSSGNKAETSGNKKETSSSKETTSRPSSSSSAAATSGEKNALSKALQYLDYTAFSYSGLIEQLEFEGFSHSEAVYGVDHCGADWNEQAAKKAQQYLDYSAFSRPELIDQLLFEGFTQAEAEYGVNKVY